MWRLQFYIDDDAPLKVSKSQKQIGFFSILPKKQRKKFDPRILATSIEVFCLFFGRIENKIICFRDLLTFNGNEIPESQEFGPIWHLDSKGLQSL